MIAVFLAIPPPRFTECLITHIAGYLLANLFNTVGVPSVEQSSQIISSSPLTKFVFIIDSTASSIYFSQLYAGIKKDILFTTLILSSLYKFK